MNSLFEAIKVGSLTLPNRIIMAPLTRMRAEQPGNIPNILNARYYKQRASAGLIISEATQISQQGQGYPCTPGIHSPEQVEGWKTVVEEVHKAYGRIALQLWHVGRISHSSLQPNGALPVAPSAIKPTGAAFTADWKQVPFETPHALTIAEIDSIILDYKTAAKNAQVAGFDAVEVHGANGYLLDQFLQDGSNQRTDEYGGSIENRARMLLRVVDEVIGVWGASRVGVRLSPYGTFNDMKDSDPVALFTYVLSELDKRGVAYVHLIEPRATSAGAGDKVTDAPSTSKLFREAFKGILVSAGGYNREDAKKTIEDKQADAIAFGRLYISNPDLVERLKLKAELNPYDRATFYGGGEKGYLDYPTLR